MDDLVKLLDAVSRFIAASVLPLVLFAVFWLMRKEINALIGRSNSVSFKGAGIDVSITAQQAQAAGALAAAVTSNAAAGQDKMETAETAQAAASVVAHAVTPESIQRARAATILWVDDNPDNNIFVRRSLEALGVRFVTATSTDEAADLAGRQQFDAIISDVSRGIDRTAGYSLLDQLRAVGIQTPAIIYSGSADPARRAAAKKHGAVDATNRPDELFEMVLSVLKAGR